MTNLTKYRNPNRDWAWDTYMAIWDDRFSTPPFESRHPAQSCNFDWDAAVIAAYALDALDALMESPFYYAAVNWAPQYRERRSRT